MDATQENFIRSRVAGRKLATDVLAMCLDEVMLHGPAGREAFWEHVQLVAAKAIADLHPPEGPAIDGDADQPMNDAQARAFGATQMQFGAHGGKRIDEVPLNYLQMLVDDNEFKKKLRRYLASPRIKAELEALPW